jgi:hypothetical protein
MMSGKSQAANRQTNGINQGRRRFIEGIAAAGAVAAFGLPTLGESLGTQPAVLTGDRFDLVINTLAGPRQCDSASTNPERPPRVTSSPLLNTLSQQFGNLADRGLTGCYFG